MGSNIIKKICLVCGDRAVAFNFGGLTCQSCKSFFRRNVSKAKKFSCTFQGECLISKQTRKSCRKCRLEKCFLIGMQKNRLLDETPDEVDKPAKVSDQANSKSPKIDFSNAIEEEIQLDKKKSEECLKGIEETVNRIIRENLDKQEPVLQNGFKTTSIPESNPNRTDGESVVDFNEKLFVQVHRHSLTKMLSFFDHLNDSNHLNDVEQNRLYELNQRFTLPKICSPLKSILIIDDNVKNFQHFESLSKCFVVKMKQLESFRVMCQEDRFRLMKNNSLFVIVQSILRFYEPSSKTFALPHPTDPNVLVVYDGQYLRREMFGNSFERIIALINSIYGFIRYDDSINNILMMITLFDTSDQSNTVLWHQDYVKFQYVSHCHLLWRYIETKSPDDKKHNDTERTLRTYWTLLKTMESIQALFRMISNEIIKKYDQRIIGPLTSELLNLKT